MVLISAVQKAMIVHRHILGSVQSLLVEAVTLPHQELVMALFVYGLLKVRATPFSPCTVSPWYVKAIISNP